MKKSNRKVRKYCKEGPYDGWSILISEHLRRTLTFISKEFYGYYEQRDGAGQLDWIQIVEEPDSFHLA